MADLRRLRLRPPLAVSERWTTGLCARGRGGLTAACTLIGAGALGAVLLALRYSPNSASPAAPAAQPPPTRTEERAQADEDALTVPGLLNAGNNCFLNVILQALASTKAVVTFVAACAEVNLKLQKNAVAIPKKDTISMPLADSVSTLMKELSQLGEVSRTSSPRRVMLALRSYVKHFDLNAQQDAAEALVLLASAIQEERDGYIQWLKLTFQNLATASLILDERFSRADEVGCKRRRESDQLLDSWRGQLHWPLEGTLASSLTCQRCAYQYTTQIQSFNDISLPPVQDGEGNIIQGCTLENCLEHFTAVEWIDNVKCSYCSHEAAGFSIHSIFRDPRSRNSKGPESEDYTKALERSLKVIEDCGCDDDCGCESLTRQQGGIWRDVRADASKQLRIGRSPGVLCFQLQRVTMRGDGALMKLTGHIAFPKVLDLFPFTIAAESSVQTRNSSPTEQKNKSIRADNPRQVSEALAAEDVQDDHPSPRIETRSFSQGKPDLGKEIGPDATEPLRRPQVTPEICHLDSIESPRHYNFSSTEAVSAEAGNESLEQSEGTTQPSSPQQGPKYIERLEVHFDKLRSPNLGSTSGNSLTFSPLSLSMSAPYVPRVYTQLQQWSFVTSPREGQQLSTSSAGGLGNLSAMSNRPGPKSGGASRGSKYSKRLLYELVSVVVHQGGAGSGHYIVYRRMAQPNLSQDLHSKKDTPALERTLENNATGVTSDSHPAMWHAGAVDNDQVEQQSSSTEEISESIGTEEQELSISPSQSADGERLVAEDCTDDTMGMAGNTAGMPAKLISLWFRVSDTHVQRVAEQEVFSAHASLLFYEQL